MAGSNSLSGIYNRLLTGYYSGDLLSLQKYFEKYLVKSLTNQKIVLPLIQHKRNAL